MMSETNLTARNDSAAGRVMGILDRVAASLLALCPILQHYRGLIYNAALTVMVVIAVYLVCRMAAKWKDFRLAALKPVWVLIAYMVYRVVDHGTSVTEVGQSGVLIIYFVAAAMDCIDIRWLCRTAMVVSGIAVLALMAQYFCFYVLDFHLQLVPTELLLPSADQWVLGVQTGLAGINGTIRPNGFYRPSAFFLEPSHVYVYIFPHLMIKLFGKRHGYFHLGQAVVLSLGLVLCTSGMGIAAVCLAWGLFLAFYNEETQTFSLRNLLRRRTKILLACAAVAFIVAVIVFPPIRTAVVRIFTNDPGKRTAIGGRVAAALEGLRDMNLRQWIFGVEDTTHGISYNMPGLIAAVYRHGLIGMVLSAEFYTKSIWKLKMPFCLPAAVILITSFFSAHTHSTVGMMYFVLILMWGYHTRARTEGLLDTLRGIKNRTA